MNDAEFKDKMTLVDDELSRRGLQPHQRPFHAIRLVDPEFHGAIGGVGVDEMAKLFRPFEGPNLFNAICKWYDDMYGERMKGIGPITRIPLLIKNEVYLATIPLIYGEVKTSVLNCLPNVTLEMLNSLSPNEKGDLFEKWRQGYELSYEIHVLHTPSLQPRHSKAGAEEIPNLLVNAMRDRDAALNAIEDSRQGATALFHSQQLAEKSMKAVLMASGTSLGELKGLGHRIESAFERCVQCEPKLASVSKDVKLISDVTMDVRYDRSSMAPKDVVERYWAAMRIAALSACVICGVGRRLGVLNLNRDHNRRSEQVVKGVMRYRS